MTLNFKSQLEDMSNLEINEQTLINYPNINEISKFLLKNMKLSNSPIDEVESTENNDNVDDSDINTKAKEVFKSWENKRNEFVNNIIPSNFSRELAKGNTKYL